MGRTRKVGEIVKVEKKWLSTAETKRYLDCGEDFLYNLRDTAAISSTKINGKYFYELSSIERLLEKNKVKAIK
ncbi:helix-turn-helix domain-containing protein [uncultured Butyricimonas sp.]|jgi:hypothetical protein|uniref:helix-turn-helix domain-containing protein n=1 Tax=uncultured Butyricimonas sp. TaxID=1268785 RepID=UPI0026DD3501|nr:helix-turn-helix domain-containing protein [uncultured Butyricimonas sp.]